MKKRRLTSFDQYQKTLLKKGMAIAADCTHGSFGQVYYSHIIRNPSDDLLSSMKVTALGALSENFQKLNHEHHVGVYPKMSESKYTAHLVKEFEEEQSHWEQFKKNSPFLEWIDEGHARNGIISKAKSDITFYLELRVRPDWLKDVWDYELDIEVDEKTDSSVQEVMDGIIEELEIDLEYHYDFDWVDMVRLDYLLRTCCRTKTQYKNAKSSYLTALLSPIFDNYNQSLVYLASPDTTYFVIGRPYFYPIIAGERSDGSHEITIFEACNEF